MLIALSKLILYLHIFFLEAHAIDSPITFNPSDDILHTFPNP
jgi:hypothetical protein